MRMEHGIGEFVVDDTPLASLALEEPPEQEVIAALQEAYSIARHRTVEHDTAFGIRQIVDIALRALSPSINDTTTAAMCVDYLTAILARLASRSILLYSELMEHSDGTEKARYSIKDPLIEYTRARRSLCGTMYATLHSNESSHDECLKSLLSALSSRRCLPI